MSKLKVGYMGPNGTYSSQAAKIWATGEVELVPFKSNVEVLEALAARHISRAVVPVENLLGDLVDETIDYLMTNADAKKLRITGEIFLPIEHVLAGKPQAELGQITMAISHSQPLRQCQTFIGDNHLKPQSLEAGASTARAAEIVALEETPVWTAAISSRQAAENFGLKILAENIADCKNNVTRFLVFGGPESLATGSDKITIFLVTDDKPGALYHVLGVFYFLGINLTKIDSRTAKTNIGECIFWIDAEGHAKDKAMAVALEQLSQRFTKKLWIVGSYPKGKPA